MKDRVPKHPGRVTLTPVPGQTNTYDRARADEPIVAGDALNKANLLPDDVAQALGLAQENPQVKDALLLLAEWACRVVGQYTGTGTYGSADSNRLTFSRPPKMVFIGPSSRYGGVVKILWPGATIAGSYYDSRSLLHVSWSDDNCTVSWASYEDAEHQCNSKGVLYQYVAFL